MKLRDEYGDVEVYGPSIELPERPGSEAAYYGRSLPDAIARLQATVDAERAS